MSGSNTPPSVSDPKTHQGVKVEGAQYEPAEAIPEKEISRSAGQIAKSVVGIIGLFAVAAVAAVGQHLFYDHIQGLEPPAYFIPQDWVIRIGTTFATVFQMALAACIGTIFTEASWYCFQKTATSVEAIDATFKVCSDPKQFLVGELYMKAKIVLLLAVVIWASQLTSILSPGALTVVTSLQSSTSDQLVPSLGSFVGNAGLIQLAYYQASDMQSFGQASPNLARLAMRVFTSGEIVSWSSPCGINCSYTITFDGPAYECTDRPLVPAPITSYQLLYATSPIHTTLPDGLDYVNITGQSQVSEGISFNRTVWNDGTEDPPDATPANGSFNIAITDCILYAATYTVNVLYENNVPNITATVDPYQQIYSSVFAEMDLIGNNFVGENKSLYDPEGNPDNQTVSFANFYAIEQALEALLKGNMTLPRSAVTAGPLVSNEPQIETNLLYWSYVDYSSALTQPLTYPSNFSKAVEDLLINTTISLISWAPNPPPNDTQYFWLPDITAAIYTSSLVSTSPYPARYNYAVQTLWEIYGTALFIGCLCLILGFYLMMKSAVPGADLSFAEVLVTTRNPKLDELCRGSNLGGDTISKNVLKAKLKFGKVKDSGNVGFGLDNDILPLAPRRLG